MPFSRRCCAPVTSIELLVVLLMLVMAVPDLCAWIGRPALSYPAFVCFGVMVGPLVRPEVANMVREAGEIGFVLLLFEVGLEIDLPIWRKLKLPALYLVRWVAPQYPLLVALGLYSGLGWLQSFVAAAALSACSVGMAYAAWKTYPGLNEGVRPFVLHVMVLLEVVAVVLLAVETSILGTGPSWYFIVKLAGIALVIYTCSRISEHVTKALQAALERATRWRLHFVALLVLAICAVGDRLGLAAPKTAFFLGLFSSRVRHDGRSLEDYLAPISKRFLIPLFFTSLGAQLPLTDLFSRAAVLAVASAAAILVFRHFLHRRMAPTGGDANAYLLLCPNFTLVALAANSFLAQPDGAELTPWLLITGLLVTMYSVLALPVTKPAALAPV
jgi:Kef-type K+ transport system membrane component KefB